MRSDIKDLTDIAGSPRAARDGVVIASRTQTIARVNRRKEYAVSGPKFEDPERQVEVNFQARLQKVAKP